MSFTLQLQTFAELRISLELMLCTGIYFTMRDHFFELQLLAQHGLNSHYPRWGQNCLKKQHLEVVQAVCEP